MKDKLIIGVDMARPGSEDHYCIALRIGKQVHIIPDPFANALLKKYVQVGNAYESFCFLGNIIPQQFQQHYKTVHDFLSDLLPTATK